jgi:hypothetical protein
MLVFNRMVPATAEETWAMFNVPWELPTTPASFAAAEYGVLACKEEMVCWIVTVSTFLPKMPPTYMMWNSASELMVREASHAYTLALLTVPAMPPMRKPTCLPSPPILTSTTKLVIQQSVTFKSRDFPTKPPMDLLFSLPMTVTWQFSTVTFTIEADPFANRGDA